MEAELVQEKLEKESIKRSENTQKEMIEVIRLESSSALEMEKDNNSKKAGLEETKRAKMHVEIIRSKDKEIEELKRRL